MVAIDTAAGDLLQLARTRRITRIPVYRENPGNIVGIVHVLDAAIDESIDKKTARDYIRPPQFIPGSTPTDELLPRMRLTRQPMALITDDQSVVIGLVTLGGVLQEIVGGLKHRD